jgi:Tfp pilus assembly protein FimT
MTNAFKFYLCGALVLVALASGVKLPSLSQVRAANPITTSWGRINAVLRQAEEVANGK